MIEAQGLSRRFGHLAAVEDASFVAADGCITGLLGPNGAGKTTTLRMIYGLLRPDAGRVRIDGLDVSAQTREAQRRLGVLSDQRGLYKRLTVRENIVYFAQLQGLAPDAARVAAQRLIDTLEMRDFAEQRADGLSQGQRVRTAIARALVHDPPNLILDEPTNGLDVMATRALRGFLQRLRAAGHCIVFSSHVMQEVATLCDVVVVMARGRVVARGTPQELLDATGAASLEDAFVEVIGSGEGLMA